MSWILRNLFPNFVPLQSSKPSFLSFRYQNDSWETGLLPTLPGSSRKNAQKFHAILCPKFDDGIGNLDDEIQKFDSDIGKFDEFVFFHSVAHFQFGFRFGAANSGWIGRRRRDYNVARRLGALFIHRKEETGGDPSVPVRSRLDLLGLQFFGRFHIFVRRQWPPHSYLGL